MKKITLIFTLLLPLTLSAQEFDFVLEPQAFPVTMESGWQPWSPWVGGFNNSIPVLADIDADGDQDFFLGNREGYVAYWDNSGSEIIPDFKFVTNEL